MSPPPEPRPSYTELCRGASYIYTISFNACDTAGLTEVRDIIMRLKYSFLIVSCIWVFTRGVLWAAARAELKLVSSELILSRHACSFIKRIFACAMYWGHTGI